jgi:hypothetical protein
LTEATEYYKKLGKECVANGVCVDVFLFPNAHIDVASIAPVSQLSGGSVYKYQYFDVSSLSHSSSQVIRRKRMASVSWLIFIVILVGQLDLM